jgi:hypothetical protein
MARDRRRGSVAKTLKTALLEEGPMARALFEYELEEHIDYFVQSKRDEGDEYLLAVTENRGHVAMLLIDKDDAVLVNEEARNRLQELWPVGYRNNMKLFIPQMVGDFEDGQVFVAGVNTVRRPQ